MSRFFDWFLIFTFPLCIAGIWTTDSVEFLRFLAFLWAIGAFLQAIHDRAAAKGSQP